MRITSRLALAVAFVATAVSTGAASDFPDQMHERQEPTSVPLSVFSSSLPSSFQESTSTFTDDSRATLTSTTPVRTAVSTIIIPDGRPQPSSTSKGVGSGPAAASTSTPVVSEASSAENGQTNDNLLAGMESSPPWDVNPSALPDIPVTAVFLVLFFLGACVHGWRLHRNNKLHDEDLKHIFSSLVLSFCVFRVTTCILRIIYAAGQHNTILMVVEMIFLEMG